MTAICTDALDELLDEVLAESPQRAAIRSAQEFDRIAAPFENRVIVFGSGYLGRLAASGLRTAGVEVLAFCDNNPRLWGTEIDCVPVVSPWDAAAIYKHRAAFVVAIYNSSRSQQQLRSLGCTRVIPYPVLFWKHWLSMPKEDRLELPQRILERADEMRPAYDLLADDRSREEFCAQIRWRCLLDYTCLPLPHKPSEMYFPSELFRLSTHETLVDCGAFDGDSIRTFLGKTGDRFQQIYAIEADAANVALLRRYCTGLPVDVAAKVSILPFAIGRHDGTVKFCAEGSVGSKVVESDATHEVECRSLDSLLGPESRPSLIKMDIEGAEPDAIMGATHTIARSRPIMAVCAYHKCDHLWIIPQLLKAANPGYRIFLRRYAEDCWETVYYAIPPERLLI